jgi:hypothetical protein
MPEPEPSSVVELQPQSSALAKPIVPMIPNQDACVKAFCLFYADVPRDALEYLPEAADVTASNGLFFRWSRNGPSRTEDPGCKGGGHLTASDAPDGQRGVE